MKRDVVFMAFAATLSMVGSALAQPGMAPVNTAIAEYHADTGQIIVSVNEIFNWFIEDVDFQPVFTGDPANLPAGFGLPTDNDFRVGQSRIGNPFTYTDQDLGNVAITGLTDGALTIFWDHTLGQPTENQPVVCIGCGPGGLVGDYNNDGTVNAADYPVWRDGNSPDSSQAGYDVWKDNYGNVAGAGATFGSLASANAIPEPASAVTFVLGLAMLSILARRR